MLIVKLSMAPNLCREVEIGQYICVHMWYLFLFNDCCTYSVNPFSYTQYCNTVSYVGTYPHASYTTYIIVARKRGIWFTLFHPKLWNRKHGTMIIWNEVSLSISLLFGGTLTLSTAHFTRIVTISRLCKPNTNARIFSYRILQAWVSCCKKRRHDDSSFGDL